MSLCPSQREIDGSGLGFRTLLPLLVDSQRGRNPNVMTTGSTHPNCQCRAQTATTCRHVPLYICMGSKYFHNFGRSRMGSRLLIDKIYCEGIRHIHCMYVKIWRISVRMVVRSFGGRLVSGGKLQGPRLAGIHPDLLRYLVPVADIVLPTDIKKNIVSHDTAGKAVKDPRAVCAKIRDWPRSGCLASNSRTLGCSARLLLTVISIYRPTRGNTLPRSTDLCPSRPKPHGTDTNWWIGGLAANPARVKNFTGKKRADIRLDPAFRSLWDCSKRYIER